MNKKLSKSVSFLLPSPSPIRLRGSLGNRDGEERGKFLIGKIKELKNTIINKIKNLQIIFPSGCQHRIHRNKGTYTISGDFMDVKIRLCRKCVRSNILARDGLSKRHYENNISRKDGAMEMGEPVTKESFLNFIKKD